MVNRVLSLHNQLEVLLINSIKYKLYSSNFKNIKIYYSRFLGITRIITIVIKITYIEKHTTLKKHTKIGDII